MNSRPLIALVAVASVLGLALIGLYAYDSSRADLVAEGVSVGGVAVGGLTAAEARVRGMQREYGARATGVGPLRPELVEERVARRRARLLTRIRISDATRDPFVEWLAGRGGSC